MVSVGTAKMIHCRRRCWWWCVHDVRLKITMHRCGVWTCMSAANACWIVLCKCMLDIKCSVLRGWSCAITKSFEFWLRTDEKMGLTLSPSHMIDPLPHPREAASPTHGRVHCHSRVPICVDDAHPLKSRCFVKSTSEHMPRKRQYWKLWHGLSAIQSH